MARSKQGKAPSKVKYSPPKRFTLDLNDPRIIELVESLPQGLAAIVANESARFTSFHASMSALILPFGSRLAFHTGCYVVDSSNKSVLSMNEKEDWVMLMGDDHEFPPQMVIKLLALMYQKDLDILVPLCFKRSFPPAPVIYDLGDDLLPYHVDLAKHPTGGLIEVYCAGTAGMIIRKRVIDKMVKEKDMPIFQLGGVHWGEDLDFCRRARQHGFKVWCDLDMPMGHVVLSTIWPKRTPAGWVCNYEFAHQGGFDLGL